MAAEGFNNKTIAQKIELSAAVVGIWRKRFIQQGLMGLYDEPKSGGPRSISDEQVARLIRKTLNKKPRGDRPLTVDEVVNIYFDFIFRALSVNKASINKRNNVELGRNLDSKIIR